MTRFRVGIVGLGGLGSAAAWWSSRRLGEEVVGFEQYELGHRRGASQDHSRIIRLSYHRPDAVRLAADAYEAWAEAEAAAGVELVVRTGGLDLYPEGASIDAADYLSSMDACQVDYEELDAVEATGRWPALRLDPGTRVVFQAESGLVRAAVGNTTHRALAEANGATLLGNTPVTAVEPTADGYAVIAGGERFDVDRLIVTADAWTNRVTAGLGWECNLLVTQEQVAYFGGYAGDLKVPVWIWMDAPGFYGLPGIDGSGLKIGQDVGGPRVTGDDRSFDPDPDYRERLIRFQESLLPGTTGTVVEERTCLYTMPPDREFVIDRVPGHEHAVVGLGAAHGFKFASVFGKALAELAIDGRTVHDVSGWPATRPVLTEPDPVWSFLI